ncbi:hypothetical protein [Streptomyces sp. SID13031]|uniref:hypothetical protein n=1 Tax=Streptomyces sp. SID13031 TaxID=2706046 RepID=UPI0013C732D1|nr:hypothetical protein [Streptomyces sp. SID13031]NEA33957.1 hypothetical protein [Streptomyces sp. SID13031]
MDDDELAQATGIMPRQIVNQICRDLAASGLITRSPGRLGKIVNAIEPATEDDEPVVVDPATQPAGSSFEQRSAEGAMLEALGRRLGVALRPTRIVHPSGAKVEIDGADPEQTVLAECWAHQGSAKVAQKYKLVNDAVKLHWIAQVLPPIARRLVLCVSDEAAVRHLRGRSWQGQAITGLGVSLEVVSLPDHVVAAILEAQKRQYR